MRIQDRHETVVYMRIHDRHETVVYVYKTVVRTAYTSAKAILTTVVCRVRPIPCWRPISDTIGRSCTDTGTNTDTRNDVPHSLRQTYVTYVAHTVHTFQNITPLMLCLEMYETQG